MAIIDDVKMVYQLNEESGDRACAHGSGHTLTDYNTVGFKAGKLGNAADFVAANSERLGVADHADFSVGGDEEFTLWAWVNADLLAGDDRVIAGHYKGSSRSYMLFYRTALNRFVFRVRDAANTTNYEAVGDTLGIPAASTWYLLIGHHDPAANQIGIQANNGGIDTTALVGGSRDAATEFCVGSMSEGGDYWDGLIDQVVFKKGLLSAQDRTDLYNGGSGLVYPFAQGAGIETKRALLGVG